MGSKKIRQRSGSNHTAKSPNTGPPWVLISGLVTLVVAAALVLYPTSSPEAPGSNSPSESMADSTIERPPAPIATKPGSPKPPADALLPPLPVVPDRMPRSPEVIKAAYEYAARHPEILEYVPCFCGCETAGHSANANCFVASRHADGSVKEWDTHGMSCIICVDVARAAEQLHASGASVSDIRNAVEAQYATSPRMTPTPVPPPAD